jgi:hypothetical protein
MYSRRGTACTSEIIPSSTVLLITVSTSSHGGVNVRPVLVNVRTVTHTPWQKGH